MLKKSKYSGNLNMLILGAGLIVILIICCVNAQISKKSVLAGWSSGGLIDYELLLYTDSTYYLSTEGFLLGYNPQGYWEINNDTFLLIRNDTLRAEIHNQSVVQYYDPKYRCLTIMELKEFDPPKIVKFPNFNKE